jgi:hypothetical protein
VSEVPADPTVSLFLATPGVLVPLGDYPAGVEAVAKHLPLGPFRGAGRQGSLSLGARENVRTSTKGASRWES